MRKRWSRLKIGIWGRGIERDHGRRRQGMGGGVGGEKMGKGVEGAGERDPDDYGYSRGLFGKRMGERGWGKVRRMRWGKQE